MRTRMLTIALVVSATTMGCLIDFSGYETAPDASAGSGDDGGVGGQGGAAGEASGGAAGETGGTAGSGGVSGSGGAQAGSGGAATGGAGGAAGSGGQAGTGGSSCTFDACKTSAGVPPNGCTPCTQSVCQTLSFCCSSSWSYECMIEARAQSACGCATAGCSDDLPSTGAGSCATGGSCNPVTGGGCGSGQCVLNLTSGQPKYECQLTGTLGACDFCEPTQSKNCAVGLSCIANRCVRVCCENPDCPIGTVCNTSVFPGTVGLCVAQ